MAFSDINIAASECNRDIAASKCNKDIAASGCPHPSRNKLAVVGLLGPQ